MMLIKLPKTILPVASNLQNRYFLQWNKFDGSNDLVYKILINFEQVTLEY